MTYTISPSSTVTTAVPVIATGISAAEILNRVADVFQVPAMVVASKCRRHEVVMARWLFWMILYSHHYTQEACARAAGYEDHSTVHNGIKRILDEIQNNMLVRHAYEKLKHLASESRQKKIAALIEEYESKVKMKL